jgi:hypothetical protein
MARAKDDDQSAIVFGDQPPVKASTSEGDLRHSRAAAAQRATAAAGARRRTLALGVVAARAPPITPSV